MLCPSYSRLFPCPRSPSISTQLGGLRYSGSPKKIVGLDSHPYGVQYQPFQDFLVLRRDQTVTYLPQLRCASALKHGPLTSQCVANSSSILAHMQNSPSSSMLEWAIGVRGYRRGRRESGAYRLLIVRTDRLYLWCRSIRTRPLSHGRTPFRFSNHTFHFSL